MNEIKTKITITKNLFLLKYNIFIYFSISYLIAKKIVITVKKYFFLY